MPAPGQPLPVDLRGTPIYTRFNRLTNEQYENSARAILKLDGPTGVTDGFLHAVTGVTDFANNEQVVLVNDTVWRDFQTAAEALAAKVTATDAALQAVVKTTDVATFIESFGRRAFRRDLTSEEIADYTAMHATGTTFSGTQSAFTKGAALVISAMLQSPHFLYRTEMADDGKPLSGYEIAAKLSFWLLDTTPSDELLDAAKSGSFDSSENLAMQAAEMLEEPAARAVMRKFHNELYKFDLYDNISKDMVPGYTEALNPELKEATYLFFDRLFTEGLGVKDLLTSNVAFAGPAMAKLYGVTVTGSGIQQITMPDRIGYYSQVPFLALWGINNDPDSIHRGTKINIDTLCAIPGMPATELPPVPALLPNQTNRERYTGLTAACGGACHGVIINPIGFAFESYDGLGRARAMDNGKPVDTTGSYPFAEGTKSFDGGNELMQIIANGKQAHQCYAKKVAGYALQRDLVEADRPMVEALGKVSLENSASIKDVMVALVEQTAFRTHVGGAR
ncbi:MAG: DUF1592 domain-containing protein [Myxococcota bacterium]|nr:DUF1592 domain-containing protein [Myxococcota bacterium]